MTILGHNACRNVAWRWLAASFLASTLGAPALAQPSRTTTTRPGWLPREQQWRNVTPAQRATAMATLERFEQLLLQIPGLASPDGFEIVPQFAGGYRTLGPNDEPFPNAIVRYSVGLMMFAPSRKVAGEGRVCLTVVVNEQPPPPKHRDSRGRQIYIEGDRGKPVPHATQVYGELLDMPGERSFADVLFTANGLNRWKPVTREEFVDALIVDVEGKDGAKMAESQAAFAKTPYQEWMEGAAQRKREREETITQARQFQSAAEVEKLRQTLEATEREVTEQLRKDDDATRERFAEARAGIAGYGADLRATLAKMSPAERTMPAYVNNALTEGPLVGGYRLTTDEAPPAWRVLTPNWDFWRSGRSPVEVRSIRVGIGISGTCLRPAIQRTLLDAFARLDWAAFRALLDDPT